MLAICLPYVRSTNVNLRITQSEMLTVANATGSSWQKRIFNRTSLGVSVETFKIFTSQRIAEHLIFPQFSFGCPRSRQNRFGGVILLRAINMSLTALRCLREKLKHLLVPSIPESLVHNQSLLVNSTMDRVELLRLCERRWKPRQTRTF